LPCWTVCEALGEHLHDPAVAADRHVLRCHAFHEGPVGDLEDRTEPVAVGLVGAEQPEPIRVTGIDVAHHLAQLARRLGVHLRRLRDVDRIVAEVRQIQVAGEPAAVGVWAGAHPQVTLRSQFAYDRDRRTGVVEELLRTVRAQPAFQNRQVFRVVPDPRQRDLM